MKLIIFGGFLGSGKTSLILSLAHYLIESLREKDDTAASRTNLVIIENEIGKVGIDDKVLKTGGYSVKELFSGCICCTLTADLTTTLNNLAAEVDPEWAIIECTGLAYPGNIIETVKKYGKGIERIYTVAVVDSKRSDMLFEMMPVLTEKQISDGDMVIINKVDLVTQDKLEELEKKVLELNPSAMLHKVTASKEIDNSIWREVAGSNV
jgi:G3E family GTPase